ncbi:helix-turn-helix transcriptional regulator [Listeria monocytogenes]|uniref:helix-turn-helix domain-containing protein n=1 Tax=Listeria monocytogenes TaxID=1639 RepID=UPI0011F27DB3|nr:helix-turn-helix transcriptional regulator [Listeria monocytogenes]TYV82340.1 helix-turn-helix transcriptional regulator [Listeria monocytogenes]
MKPNAAEVGKMIRQIRTDLGCSMAQFGELISDSPKTTVNNWERGINLPKDDKLKKIALLGKISIEELLYGSPEEFITKIGIEHFRFQFNLLFVQQVIAFLEQRKINLYDEMTVIEMIQSIMDSGAFVERESAYLSFSPIIGSDNLYLTVVTKNEESGKPTFYVYVEAEENRVHFLPYTFAERQEELYFEQPILKGQVKSDYFTRQFPLLDVSLKKSTIVYYGIDKEKQKMNVMEYSYNDSAKTFDKSQMTEKSILYKPFQMETEKMIAYLKSISNENK